MQEQDPITDEQPAPRSPTIFQPEEPRPESFVAGTLYDLTALVQTTAALLRAGLVQAVVVMFVLLGLVVVLATPSVVAACWALPFLLAVGPLLVAGPLVVFSRLALREPLTLLSAIRVAIRHVPLLTASAIGHGTAAGFIVIMNAGALGGGLAPLSLIVTVPVSLFFLSELACSVLVNVVWLTNPDTFQQRAALEALRSRTRGRQPMILVAVGVPIAIVAASSPTPFARDLVRKLLWPDAEMVFLACIAIVGGVTAILLGSALLAASYAVILGTAGESSMPEAPREPPSP